jgi:hypothetical protein
MAADTLDTRVLELRETETAMTRQILELDGLRQEMEAMLDQDDSPTSLEPPTAASQPQILVPPTAPGFDIAL